MSSVWVGDLVRLRAVEPADWEAFQRFDENTFDMRRAGMIRLPRSAAGQRAWAEKTALQEPDRDRFQVAIEARADGALVGAMSTDLVDHRAGLFSYGLAIGSEFHRRGYASEAVRILLAFMFGERRFHKCEAHVFAFNEPSLALHRKLGFTEEGRLRDHEFFAGRHHDVVCFGQTAAEFAVRHPHPSAI